MVKVEIYETEVLKVHDTLEYEFEELMQEFVADEDGNQIGVGGRLGSHPLHKEDIDKLLRRNGRIFRIVDTR